MRIVDLRDLRKTYGSIVAVDNVSLSIDGPGVVALLGANGAGKTTTLDMLLGLRRPQSGTVKVLGGSPADPRVRARIGAVPQESGVPGTLRVREIVQFVAAQYPNPFPAGEMLDAFDLKPMARRQAGGLSGGEMRRLALALAFVGRPRLVVLDEPTNGLDIEARRRVWQYIRAYASENGAVLLTTHQMDEAQALASRIVVMARGRVVREGTPDEIRRSPGSRIAFSVAACDADAAVRALRAGNVSFEKHAMTGSLEDAVLALLEESA